MSAANAADQLCRYFGGAYDAVTHTYRTPQLSVPGMDGPIVRRAAPKEDDNTSDYSLGNPGVPVGCLIIILLEEGEEQREALAGPTSGLKHVAWSVRMHCFLRAASAWGEDAQDAQYALLDAIRARIEADRTCGTGGFESGYGVGLQVGEGGSPWLKWKLSPIATDEMAGMSTGYLLVEFNADQYIQA